MAFDDVHFFTYQRDNYDNQHGEFFDFETPYRHYKIMFKNTVLLLGKYRLFTAGLNVVLVIVQDVLIDNRLIRQAFKINK